MKILTLLVTLWIPWVVTHQETTLLIVDWSPAEVLPVHWELWDVSAGTLIQSGIRTDPTESRVTSLKLFRYTDVELFWYAAPGTSCTHHAQVMLLEHEYIGGGCGLLTD